MRSFFPNFRCLPVCVSAVGVLAAVATLLQAQGYNLPWYRISGGGGTSTGGGFTLSGSIGQHDAGAMLTGGPYSLRGGYWLGVGLVQAEEAPLLTVVNAGPGMVKICWPHPSTGWVLQQNADVGTTNWVDNTSPVTVEGEDRCITLTPPTSPLFFRLRAP